MMHDECARTAVYSVPLVLANLYTYLNEMSETQKPNGSAHVHWSTTALASWSSRLVVCPELHVRMKTEVSSICIPWLLLQPLSLRLENAAAYI